MVDNLKHIKEKEIQFKYRITIRFPLLLFLGPQLGVVIQMIETVNPQR